MTESAAVISEDNTDISETDEGTAQNDEAAVTTSAQSEQVETPEEPASSKSIVVYFSCTGNTN